MWSIFDSIDPLVFLISMFIGLLYSYFTSPEPQIITKYPTPFNIKDTIYRDKKGICYKYKIKEVDCPNDRSNVKNILTTSTPTQPSK